MNKNELTDEQVVMLQLRIMSALSFYRQRPEKEAKNMADLLMLCGAAASELQERRKAYSAEHIYQYRIRNGYNGQVTEWQTIRRDQVGFVLKAQPLNAEFRIISAPQPAPVVNDELYKLANHVASSKNGLPEEWQDWAEELESEIRRAAMLQLGNSPVSPGIYAEIALDTRTGHRENKDANHE
ncbi:hypothetical protein L2109_23280 [Citrobacter portucalensis]|nr:hypothetical protein [Citrobacter portucalensis]MDE9666403.1 hypothetical protein [Citrobacter portucalensis]MDE9676222.1 hypothetical protein [Citrobacter portucalensis]